MSRKVSCDGKLPSCSACEKNGSKCLREPQKLLDAASPAAPATQACGQCKPGRCDGKLPVCSACEKVGAGVALCTYPGKFEQNNKQDDALKMAKRAQHERNESILSSWRRKSGTKTYMKALPTKKQDDVLGMVSSVKPSEQQIEQAEPQRASAIAADNYAQIEQFTSADMELPHNGYTYTDEWISTALILDPCRTQDVGKGSLPDIPISALYDVCLETFRAILRPDNDLESRLLPNISVVSMKDEIVKLLIWGNGLPMASIDYSLD